MQPWQVSLGVSLASLLPLYLLVSHELTYLAPFWPLVWSRFGFHILSVVLMVYLGVMFGVYQVTRVLVMGDVGSRVAVFDRTIRQGRAGDPELSDALMREDTGDFDS